MVARRVRDMTSPLIGLAISAALAGDGPLRIDTTVDGVAVTAVEHFDRNATRQLVAFGGMVAQLTPSGIVLLRDATTLATVREIAADAPIDSLGIDSDGALLLAAADGAVHRLSTPSGGVAAAGHLGGRALWFGTLAGVTWAVVVQPGPTETLVVRTLTGARSSPIDVSKMSLPSAHPSAVGVDPRGRLWLGWDYGEEGGAVAWVDPPTGKLHVVKDAAVGGRAIHGFVASGATLFAYGGTSATAQSAFIARVTTAGMEVLYRATDAPLSRGTRTLTSARGPGPMAPISLVVGDGDGLIVVAGADVWRTDAVLNAWSPASEIVAGQGAHRWTLGLGGAVTDVLCDTAGVCVFGTAGDGLFRRSAEGMERVAADGQLPFDPKRLVVGPTGPIALAEPFAASWSGTAWVSMPIPRDLPPFPLTVAWLTAGDGALWRIDAEDMKYTPSSHALVFYKWLGDRVDQVTRVDDTTVGPDAIVGQVDGRWRGLQVDHEASLTRVVELDGDQWLPKGTASVPNLAAVESVVGAPELALDRAAGRLLAWDPAGLVPADRPGLADQRVVTAVRAQDGALLVATPAALWRASDTAAAIVPYSQAGLRAIAIDGCARTWLAGAGGVWLVEGDVARRVTDVDGLGGRTWIDLIGTASGIVATDGTVVAQIDVACARD